MPDSQSRVTGSWGERRVQKDYCNRDVEVLFAEPEARTPSDSVGRSFFSTDSERRIVTEGWFLRLNEVHKRLGQATPLPSPTCASKPKWMASLGTCSHQHLVYVCVVLQSGLLFIKILK